MKDYRKRLNSMGLEMPEILLPQNIDLKKWAVIACDQYTQDRDYWEKVKTTTAGAPSTFNLIFPEVFLSDNDVQKRITEIHLTMERYLQKGIFKEPKQGFVYIERDTPFQKMRKGLIAAIDLEQYEWLPDARPLIRSTEGTVPERLPARMDIRRNAPLEVPHVLLLIDDETNSLLPALGDLVKKSDPVYKTGLMMDSGDVSGWFIDEGHNPAAIALITDKLEELYSRSTERYANGQSSGAFLFAAGDGNHSLAAAKGIWEEYRKTSGASNTHPCRYALVEIVNLYDPAVLFEPIHRIIFGIGYENTVSLLSELPDFTIRSVETTEELLRLTALPLDKNQSAVNRFGIISENRYAIIETSAAGIATASLQPLLDSYIESAGSSVSVDYIHDTEELFRLTSADSTAAGILLPPVNKAGLFETVARLGPLPRKSFSMGHSCEKRFYLECRKITV